MTEDLNETLGRMGNSIMSLIGTSRNLGSDYQKLIERLTRMPGGKPFAKEGKEPMQIRDRMTAVVRTKDGKIKLDENGQPMVRDTGWSLNGLTNTGFAEITALMLTDVGGTAFDYIGIGTGVTAFDPAQTDLITPVKRKAGTGTQETTAVADDTAQIVVTFAAADTLSGTQAITESGVMNAAAAGTMLCRQKFDPLNINWDAGDTLQVTWKVQAKQGA
ncbi:unnamed protein product [marine sediment metagenome]|uniref:Uncharacterized protein n=1 Tax=marine sediment metagenome TaxID=412755 RepID=X1NEY8_9ZZZZ